MEGGGGVLMFCFVFDNENCTVCTSTHDSERSRVADELLIKRLFSFEQKKTSRGPPAAKFILEPRETLFLYGF